MPNACASQNGIVQRRIAALDDEIAFTSRKTLEAIIRPH
jgi:hypothetical protein